MNFCVLITYLPAVNPCQSCLFYSSFPRWFDSKSQTSFHPWRQFLYHQIASWCPDFPSCHGFYSLKQNPDKPLSPFYCWSNYIRCLVEFLTVWILLIASLWNYLTCSCDPHISIILIHPADLTTEFQLKFVVTLREYSIGCVLFFHWEAPNV